MSEYYGDIESGDYADAYALLSSGSVTGQTYQQFPDGFARTTYEGLTELGATGDTVAVSLEATQCDGTIRQYPGHLYIPEWRDHCCQRPADRMSEGKLRFG